MNNNHQKSSLLFLLISFCRTYFHDLIWISNHFVVFCVGISSSLLKRYIDAIITLGEVRIDDDSFGEPTGPPLKDAVYFPLTGETHGTVFGKAKRGAQSNADDEFSVCVYQKTLLEVQVIFEWS